MNVHEVKCKSTVCRIETSPFESSVQARVRASTDLLFMTMEQIDQYPSVKGLGSLSDIDKDNNRVYHYYYRK